jgi:hypothetical protein
LVSLFHLLARRYNRLQAAAEGADVPPTPTADASVLSPLTPWTPAEGPTAAPAATSQQQSGAEQQQQQQQRQQTPEPPQAQQQQQQQTPEQRELELQLYADFLRIVLEVGEGLDGCWRVVGWLVGLGVGDVWEVVGVDWGCEGDGRGGLQPGLAAVSKQPCVPFLLPAGQPACCRPACLLTNTGHLPLAACFPLLQIVNSILTSALPQNPELVYTLLHRQVGTAASAPLGL